MRLLLYGLTVLIGIVLTVHLAMNGKVGAMLNNPRVGNALFWCIGACTALLIGLSGWTPGALRPFARSVRCYSWPALSAHPSSSGSLF